MAKYSATKFIRTGAIIIAVVALLEAFVYVLLNIPNVQRATMPPTALTPKGHDSPTNQNSGLSLALKRMGLERAEDHSFISPYIITPNLVTRNESIGMPVLKAPGNRRKKLISLDTILKYYRVWIDRVPEKDKIFRNCPYSECELDKLGTLSHKADLVLFICERLSNPPPKRPKDQLWSLYCYETPQLWKYPGNYESFWKDAFNVTIGYRREADVWQPYDFLFWRDSTTLLPKEEYVSIAKKKSKSAAWFVRNCRKDRWNFVKEMQKYIDIDIYGQCSHRECTRDKGECWQRLSTTYKFYLSFENSFCKDYVTEKLFKIFNNRTFNIPVTKGDVDYDKYFPSNTFVNGNKFATAKDLALYLKELGDDIPRYAGMLQEKDKLVAREKRPGHMWCDLCEYLHTKRAGVHKDIRQWSHGNSCGPGEYIIS